MRLFSWLDLMVRFPHLGIFEEVNAYNPHCAYFLSLFFSSIPESQNFRRVIHYMYVTHIVFTLYFLGLLFLVQRPNSVLYEGLCAGNPHCVYFLGLLLFGSIPEYQNFRRVIHCNVHVCNPHSNSPSSVAQWFMRLTSDPKIACCVSSNPARSNCFVLEQPTLFRLINTGLEKDLSKL